MAYNYEPQPKYLRTLVLAGYRQSTWTTTAAAAALADGALTRVQRFDGSAVIDLNPSRRSDADMSGKGTPFATNGQITGIDLKLSGVKCELSDWLAVYVLSFLLGKDVYSGGVHNLSFDTSTQQAIPTTVYLQDTSGLTYKVPDMCVTSATFTIGASGAIQVEFDMVGTGYIVAYAMPTLPAVPAESYMMASDAVATFGAIGQLPSLVGRHMSTTIKLDNQCAVHRAPGGGLYGIFVRKGKPKFSVATTIAATAADDIFTKLVNNTATQFSVAAASSGGLSFLMSVASGNFKTAKMGFDNDDIVWNVEMDESTIYGQTQPLTFALFAPSTTGSLLAPYAGN